MYHRRPTPSDPFSHDVVGLSLAESGGFVKAPAPPEGVGGGAVAAQRPLVSGSRLGHPTDKTTRVFATAMAIPRARVTRLLLHFRSRGSKFLAQPFSPSSSFSAHGFFPSLWPTPSTAGALRRAFHDGRPRGPLWRSKKLIGKEALFAIQVLKRSKGDEEKLADFMRRYVARLLKADKLAVLGELERQEEVDLSVKMGG